MRAKIKLFGILAVILPSAASAAGVSVKAGNVYFTDGSGHVQQLTSSGRDISALLAPDGRWVVFVRKVPGEKIETGAEEADPTELWQIRTDGKEAARLVRCQASEKPESIPVHSWSPHFVCAGNDLKVVPAGEYRNCLLTQQHRYFVGGGSYDWYWLLRPNGSEIGPVGEELKTFESSYREE